MKHLLAALVMVAAFHAAPASAAPALPPVVNPASGLSIPGKFIWFDLVTADAPAARAFYGRVFGWTFQDVKGASDYTVFSADGRPIGGVFQPAASGPVGTRWLGFVSVRDMETALRRLGSLGFITLREATVVPGRGTQAIVRDPQGAVFGLLQSASGDPPDDPVGSGEFFWVDLYTHDTSAAATCYSSLGYVVTPADEHEGNRLLLESGGYARAGITPLPADGRTPGWLPYVQVDDVAETIAAAVAAGGKVLLPPDATVLEGNLAVLSDPLGGVIGVIHWTPAATGEDQP